jgi:hypothetical protein
LPAARTECILSYDRFGGGEMGDKLAVRKSRFIGLDFEKISSTSDEHKIVPIRSSSSDST